MVHYSPPDPKKDITESHIKPMEIQSNLVPDEFGASVAGRPEAKYWGCPEGWQDGASIENKPGSNGWFSGPGVRGKR